MTTIRIPSQQPGVISSPATTLRFSSPWKHIPSALYGQMIGEDEAGALPSKFLGLFGQSSIGGSVGQVAAIACTSNIRMPHAISRVRCQNSIARTRVAFTPLAIDSAGEASASQLTRIAG